MRVKFASVVVVTALVVVGCKGVGHGRKPESIEISKVNSDGTVTLDSDPKQTYTCITAQLGAIVTFNGGDRGDFASRAHWTSDDPSIVRVNDYNDVVPEDPTLRYARGGVLTPMAAGSTTVRVDYLGLKASLQVDVGTSENLRVIPADADLAPDSTQTYTVRAVLGGQETDVTGVTTITLLGADGETADEEKATLSIGSGSNIVTAVASSDEVMTVSAKFAAPCPVTPTTTVKVQDIAEGGLHVGYEEGYGNGLLVQGTGELATLTATFADGKTQDLSNQFRAHFDTDRDGDGICELDDEHTGTADTGTACSDGLDNDEDGLTDLDDPGCASASDTDELDTPPVNFAGILTGINVAVAHTPACSDGNDNDGDGLEDFPDDTGCSSGDDNDETTDDTKNGTTQSTLFCASFGAKVATDTDPAEPGVLSDTLPIGIRNVQLQSFTVKAVDPCVPEESGCTPLPPFDENAPTIDGGQIIRFVATGTFTDGVTQDITKDLAWTLSTGEADVLPAVIVNGRTSVAGQVRTVGTFTGVDGCEDQDTCVIEVKATYTKGTSDETDDVVVTKTLTINATPTDDTAGLRKLKPTPTRKR